VLALLLQAEVAAARTAAEEATGEVARLLQRLEEVQRAHGQERQDAAECHRQQVSNLKVGSRKRSCGGLL